MSMLRITWRGLRARIRRLALTGSVVVLAVAFITGTVVLTDSLERAATDDVARDAAAVDLSLVPDDQPIDASMATAASRVEGVTAVATRLSVSVGVADEGGFPDPVGYGRLQVVPADAALANLNLVSGRTPAAPGEAVLDEETAERVGVDVGDSYQIFTDPDGGTAVTPLDVVGLTPRPASGGGATEVHVTVETFDAALAGTTHVPEPIRIDLRLDDAADPQVVSAEITAATGATVITGAELEHRLVHEAATLAGELQGPLLVLGLVAVIAAVFVIANTFRILVAQRTRELALLRTIGANRRQVHATVLIEALAVGLVASVVGVLVGALGAVGLAAVLDQVTMSLGGLVVDPAMVAVALLLGTAMTVVAALVPARIATRVPPLAAFRAEPDGEPGRPARRRVLIGAFATIAGAGVVVGGAWLGAAGNSTVGLPVVVLGAALGFLGVLVLGPVLMPALIGAAGGLLRRTMPDQVVTPTALAVANVRRNPGRAAATTAALLIGVTMIAGFSTVVASARAESTAFVADSFRADLTVGRSTPLPTDVVEELSALPEVGRATPVLEMEVSADVDGAVMSGLLNGMDVLAYLEHSNAEVVAGSLGDLTGADTVVLDAATARRWGATAGQTVSVSGAGPDAPPRELRVVAVLSNALIGDVAGNPALAESLDPTLGGPNHLLIDLVSDTEGEAALAAVWAAVEGHPGISVTSSLAAQDAMSDGLDQAVAVVLAVLGLAVVIAVIGITNTMSLSIHERTREIGLLRALGLSRHQLRWLISIEAALMGLVAALLGTVIGVVLAFAAAISVGMTAFTVPWLVVALCASGGAAVGLGAALVPARRAAGLSPMAALAG